MARFKRVESYIDGGKVLHVIADGFEVATVTDCDESSREWIVDEVLAELGYDEGVD